MALTENHKRLIIITGAAGTGKTTVSQYLHQHFGVCRVLTHTTRPPRQNERNGKDYYFETEASFFENHFVEYVRYSGHLYGSSEEGLKRALAEHDQACLVLDTKGAESYLRRFPELMQILYLTVPDNKELRTRMQARGDSATALQQRLESKEYIRDLKLSQMLRSKVTVLINDDWAVTKTKLAQFMATITV